MGKIAAIKIAFGWIYLAGYTGVSWGETMTSKEGIEFAFNIFKSLVLTIVAVYVAYIQIRNSNRKERREAEFHESQKVGNNTKDKAA